MTRLVYSTSISSCETAVERNRERLLGPQPFEPRPPLLTLFLSPSVRNQRHLLCFFGGDGNDVFLHGTFTGLSRFPVIDWNVRQWGVSQWMAKVINVKSALANFPAEAHDEEDTLHDGCNEEHDPTCSKKM